MDKQEGVDDAEGHRLIFSVLDSLEIRSPLDVGSATGHGSKDFAAALPGALVYGAEPVKALVQQELASGNTETVSLLPASGEALPFSDGRFEAVSGGYRRLQPIRTRIVAGQTFILFLYKIGLWRAFNFVHTGANVLSYRKGTDRSTRLVLMIRMTSWRGGLTASFCFHAARLVRGVAFIRC